MCAHKKMIDMMQRIGVVKRTMFSESCREVRDNNGILLNSPRSTSGERTVVRGGRSRYR